MKDLDSGFCFWISLRLIVWTLGVLYIFRFYLTLKKNEFGFKHYCYSTAYLDVLIVAVY